MNWPEIWEGRTPGSAALRLLLSPASLLYRLGWDAYAALYRLGFKHAKRPHCPVICVGNLVVGGSGKTPVVVALTKRLLDMGYEVVISASGYGSPASEAARLAPEGPLGATEWGDEPALLRVELPEVPLIVGRRRVLAAEICAEKFPSAVMVMDDGAQHLPLARDLTLLVDPPRDNRMCLPAGPYREPRRSFRESFRGGIAVSLPGDFEIKYTALELFDVGGERVPTPAVANLLCALGNPASFVKSVEESGVEVRERILRPDHDPLTGGAIWPADPALPVVVTLKDWVKLRDRSDLGMREVLIARRSAAIMPEGKLDDLLRRVTGK